MLEQTSKTKNNLNSNPMRIAPRQAGEQFPRSFKVSARTNNMRRELW